MNLRPLSFKLPANRQLQTRIVFNNLDGNTLHFMTKPNFKILRKIELYITKKRNNVQLQNYVISDVKLAKKTIKIETDKQTK